MDINRFNIIKKPVISSKAAVLLNKQRKLLLEVHPDANKPEIVKALESLFDVKVKKVSIIVRKGKVKKFRRRTYVRPLTKRAIITLADGYSVDALGQMSVDQTSDQDASSQAS